MVRVRPRRVALWMREWCVHAACSRSCCRRVSYANSQGPNEKGGTCPTCHEDHTHCVGHYGYVKLALPVFHIGYFRPTITMLQCICKVSLRRRDKQADGRHALASSSRSKNAPRS
jgi:hypothetical protein